MLMSHRVIAPNPAQLQGQRVSSKPGMSRSSSSMSSPVSYQQVPSFTPLAPCSGWSTSSNLDQTFQSCASRWHSVDRWIDFIDPKLVNYAVAAQKKNSTKNKLYSCYSGYINIQINLCTKKKQLKQMCSRRSHCADAAGIRKQGCWFPFAKETLAHVALTLQIPECSAQLSSVRTGRSWRDIVRSWLCTDLVYCFYF